MGSSSSKCLLALLFISTRPFVGLSPLILFFLPRAVMSQAGEEQWSQSRCPRRVVAVVVMLVDAALDEARLFGERAIQITGHS